jgi:hypothetical protein
MPTEIKFEKFIKSEETPVSKHQTSGRPTENNENEFITTALEVSRHSHMSSTLN